MSRTKSAAEPVPPADAPSRSRIRRTLGGSPLAWCATAVFVALLVVWSMITPDFRNPDEPQHVNSVLRVASGGGWPKPAEAHFTEGVLRARTLAGFSAVDGQRGNWSGGTLLPGVRAQLKPSDQKYFALFSTRPVTPDSARLPFSELKATRPLDLTKYGDQMTQHPPLYYVLSAGVVGTLGAQHWRFDTAVGLMRLVSVALVGLVPLMAFSVTRTLTGNRRLADLAAVLPLAIPQLASIGSSVTNDALVIFLGGLAAVLLAKTLCGDRSWRTLLLTGLTLGLGLLTKGTLLTLVPVVGLAVVVGARWPTSAAGRLSWRATVLRLAAVWGLAFAVGGWWWAVNVLRYGHLQPEGVPGSGAIAPGQRSSILEYAGTWLTRLTTTFWGDFGWLELPINSIVAVVLTVVLTLAVLLSLRAGRFRLVLLSLLSFFLLTALAMFASTYSGYEASGQYAGIQGRYLFGALVPVFAAAAIGLGALTSEEGRIRRWLPVIALPIALAMAAYGLVVGFLGFYLDVGWTPGGAWHRMVDWSPWPGWAAVGLLVALVLLSAAALVISVWSARRPLADDPYQPGARRRQVDAAAVPAT